MLRSERTSGFGEAAPQRQLVWRTTSQGQNFEVIFDGIPKRTFESAAASETLGSFQPLAAICTKVRFCLLLWAACRLRQAVSIQRGLRFAVAPLIEQANFNACFNARNAADGFSRCANILKFGQN